MSFYVKAPFNDEQQKSINTYQRDEVMTPLVCVCGRKLYATTSGMACASCLKVQGSCPKFIASGAWKTFIKKSKDLD